jgi:transcription initiation factor TFIIIB Brf1 subunit/transcription initiation factor TFIIB
MLGIEWWGPSAARTHITPSLNREPGSERRAPNNILGKNQLKSLSQKALSGLKLRIARGFKTSSNIKENKFAMASAYLIVNARERRIFIHKPSESKILKESLYECACIDFKPYYSTAPFKLSPLSTIEMRKNTRLSGKKQTSMGCDHHDVVWDPERHETICRSCGEVLSDFEMAPQIRHNSKLETVLSYTSLNLGTLPPEGAEKTDLDAVRKAEKICVKLSMPQSIVKEAAIQARKILKAARKAPRRVTILEAAAAGVVFACKLRRHPYSIKRIAEAAGMESNRLYRLMNRISRFYNAPTGMIPPQQYIRMVSASLRKAIHVNPHYMSLTELYAYRMLRENEEGFSSANKIYTAAAAIAAADGNMAGRIGTRRVAAAIGAGLNGTFKRLVRRLKNSHVPPPAEAMRHIFEGMWRN